MSDLEQTIKNAEAGDWLDAMCAVAMDNKQVVFKPTSLWEDAGPALEWLIEHSYATRTECEFTEGISQMEIWVDFDYMGTKSVGTGYYAHLKLAIARAVCLVGLRENPEKMEAAATALERSKQ